ncbi:MAG: PfkB family carbohydrate kinase [Alphaproteobacteria bacterium]|nr:PfkB family carbohydrate kinase [Alphaproteobacteria bacterium]
MEEFKKYDFIGIGDTAVDIFIELEAGEIHSTKSIFNLFGEKKETLHIPWGSKIPFKKDTTVYGVGNSANASVAAARLGLSSAFLTVVGDDTLGDMCVAQLKKNGVDDIHIQRQKNGKTNVHYVLTKNAERTILVKHETYTISLPKNLSVKYLYLSSLGKYAETLHDDIADWLEQAPHTVLVFQPGTFQMSAGVERLKRIYARAGICICNVEEAQLITKQNIRSIHTLLATMQALSPNGIICITDGPKGSYMRYNNQNYFCPIYPDIAPPTQRTGAGDAFASTFTSMLALGYSPEDALLRAPINSMAVVQAIGAQTNLLTMHSLEKYLATRPHSYTVKKI